MERKNRFNPYQFKIREIWPADQNVLWVLIEGPSKRFNDLYPDDHVFYVGLIGAYQLATQEEMLDAVLDNIYSEKEKLEKIQRFKAILEKQEKNRRLPPEEENNYRDR